jgi:hypothetical protein
MQRSLAVRLLLCLSSLLATACGAGVSDVEGSSAALASVAGGDLGRGWKTLQVSETPGTIGHHGRLAFSSEGKAVAVWSEPDQKDYSIQNIWTASLDGAAWSKGPHLTTNTTTQNAFPSIVSAGDRIHVVWNGAPSGDDDLFHVALAGGVWSERTDLTSGFKPDRGDRTDYLPAIAAAPSGTLAVAYNSKPVERGSMEIRLLRLDAGGRPLAGPVVAIAPPDAASDCYGPTAAFDGDGHLHVVAECGPLGEEHLYWGTDASGSWVVSPIAFQGRTDVQAHLARGIGRALELVWTAFTPCSAGACGDILAATIEGTQVGSVRHVTSTPDVNEVTPLAVVDKTGRLIVGYSSRRDAYLVWSTGASSFSAPMNLAPGSTATWEYLDALALDPVTGAPHVLYTRVFPGTQPLNAEIMHAFWTSDAR